MTAECKKIMVVDDESDIEFLIKQKFRQKIRDHQYEFEFASNGREALEKLSNGVKADVVLSDINMPEMDGLTLLTNISEEYPLTKTVMISAYGDMENIRSAMNKGAFDFITKPVNFIDLELTMEKTFAHVANLKRTLQAIKENDILKMYVDESVLNFMTSKEYESRLVENELIEATVAFIDICSFTSLSERESPDVVVSILNSYFDLIVTEIHAQSGVVDKFIGDCVLAIFKGQYHLDRAIETCISIRDKVKLLPSEYDFSPHVSIGINSGEMVYGNIGAPKMKRLDFTVIGDTVNTAQRLQSIAQADQIVIAKNCYDQVKQSFICNDLGMVQLKNKSSSVNIYEVIS
jgi:adenylate cyclase